MGSVTSVYVILVSGGLTWRPGGAGSDRVAEGGSCSWLTCEGVRVAEARPGLEGERGVHIEGGARHPAAGECV